MSEAELEGLVAIVTGAGSGIGLATSRLLAARGARVAGFDLAPAGIDWPDALALEVDVCDQAAVSSGVAAVHATWGRTDIVVNNAGIAAVGATDGNSDEEWHRVLDVHVVSIARMARATLPHLRISPCAAVVNTCSIAATAGLPGRALYSAAKGAVAALTRAMAADCLGDRIRVNCVAPGTVDTPWVEGLLKRTDDPEAERRALIARQPWGRLGTAEEVAEVIAFLAGPRASFTTGSTFETDGGMSALRVR